MRQNGSATPPSPWTPELEQGLIQLWGEGKSATEISSQLGHDITRSAVLGKVHRLKLPKRVEGKGGGPRPMSPEALKFRAAQRKVQQRIQKERAVSGISMKIKAKAEVPEFEVDMEALKTPAWDALPGTIPIALHEMPSTGQCRWPIGQASPFMFCGCATVEGSSYCATHKARSTGIGSASERTAHVVKARHLEAVQ